MKNGEPMIKPMPTEERFRKLVDALLPPGTGQTDAAVKAFIDIVLTVANAEDIYQWNLANTAVRHAFAKSEAFERAFRSFAGWPDRAPYAADRYMVIAAKEM